MEENNKNTNKSKENVQNTDLFSTHVPTPNASEGVGGATTKDISTFKSHRSEH